MHFLHIFAFVDEIQKLDIISFIMTGNTRKSF